MPPKSNPNSPERPDIDDDDKITVEREIEEIKKDLKKVPEVATNPAVVASIAEIENASPESKVEYKKIGQCLSRYPNL